MHPKQFALTMGIVFMLLGALSFIPGLSAAPVEGMPPLNIETSYFGYFLGLFPQNIINKLVLLCFGLAGLWAANVPYRNLPASISFARWSAVVFGVLAVMGLIPATQTLFGYAPLWGHEVWLHALFCALGAYFGFALTSKVPKQPTGGPKVHHI